MGILDPKTRIFDTFLTVQGREQLAQGKFRAEYYSFSDSGALYLEDTLVSGSLGVTDRFCLEAGSLPQDQVSFEADDAGHLIAGRALDQVYSGSGFRYIQGKGGTLVGDGTKVTSLGFASLAGRLLDSSIRNWENLMVLGSPDQFDDRFDEFLVSTPNLKFDIVNDRPISQDSVQSIGINEVESLWQDKRLSHIPNFKFLPPVNRSRIGFQERALLGRFQNTRQLEIQSWQDLEPELSRLDAIGYRREVSFVETSRDNNLFCQFFELNSGQIIKLDIIDFGEFSVPDDQDNPARHVFFVGKVFQDDYGTSTFVNLFTLVWR